MPKQKCEECKTGAPEWMCTFADMMSLLLTFFVLLLSFSNTEIVKFRTMAGSIRNAFGLRSEFDIMNEPVGRQTLPIPAPAFTNKKAPSKTKLVVAKVRDALEKSPLKENGSVEVTDRGVLLRLDGDAVFASGKADLTAEAQGLLDRLVKVAGESDGTIEVEGHTDDVPIHTARFPSNWELSAARAGSAVRYMTGKGVPPRKLKAIGFADTVPRAPNDSAENRARNRRVEFLFVTKDGEEAEAEEA